MKFICPVCSHRKCKEYLTFKNGKIVHAKTAKKPAASVIIPSKLKLNLN